MPASTTILNRLAAMADRLGLSSNQVMLMYAANAGWTNLEMTAAGVNVLHKLAGDHKIDLYDEDPFIVQLIAKGVILPTEAQVFGWKVKPDAQGQTTQSESGDTNGANGAAKPLGGCT